uniref:Uncharacterized protein n=1 Tax=Panagrolaimus davidi TaxID=227884 RepID=A0A914QD78_9BILA
MNSNINSNNVTVTQSSAHQSDKDEASRSQKNRNGVIQKLKAGIKDVVDKISRSQNRERHRTPQEILEEIKPHFIKTLNPSEDGEELRKELYQQINGTEVKDVRMIQNGKTFENQFTPKK